MCQHYDVEPNLCVLSALIHTTLLRDQKYITVNTYRDSEPNVQASKKKNSKEQKQCFNPDVWLQISVCFTNQNCLT